MTLEGKYIGITNTSIKIMERDEPIRVTVLIKRTYPIETGGLIHTLKFENAFYFHEQHKSGELGERTGIAGATIQELAGR